MLTSKKANCPDFSNSLVNFIGVLKNWKNTSIKFTKELEKSGQLAFLDVSIQQMEDGSLATCVYRKPTHADRYLQYSSHHPVNQKVSVARTLFSRANSITSNNEKKIEEFHQITKTLKNNGFPSNKCSFKKCLKNHNFRKTETVHFDSLRARCLRTYWPNFDSSWYRSGFKTTSHVVFVVSQT